MASKTKSAGEAAAAGAAGGRHTAGRGWGRAKSRGRARKRRSTRSTAGGVGRHDARERVTLAGGAACSRGIGLADQSNWWLDPHSPSQVAFARPPGGIDRGSPVRRAPERAAAAVSAAARRASHEPLVTPWTATGSFCLFGRKPRPPQTRR